MTLLLGGRSPVELPPALFKPLREAAIRERALARLLRLEDDESRGQLQSGSKEVPKPGKKAPAEPDHTTDDSVYQARKKALRVEAGLAHPEPNPTTPEELNQADRNGWLRLREQRRRRHHA